MKVINKVIKLTIDESFDDPSKARPVYFIARNINCFFPNWSNQKNTLVNYSGGQLFTVKESAEYIRKVLEED